MEIISLSSDAFRNLASARGEFHPRLNLIMGDNGHGKTNLLEALAVVSGRPSFRTTDLAEVRQSLAARTVLSVRLRSEEERQGSGILGAVLTDGAREHFWDGRRISRLSASRALPAVFLTARDLTRLSGPPAERRRALDRAVLAQEADYARTVHAYERARGAKTRLLSLKSFDLDELAVYEGTLCEAGARIAEARRRALAELGEELSRQAEALGSPFQRLSLALVSDLPLEGSAPHFAEAMRQQMRDRKAEERRAGRCLVGPHRDDIVLKSEGMAVAPRASSGETRTFILAWTLAEMALVAAAAGTEPVLAFDDFDSEWDPRVLAAFAEALPDTGQIFLTSARPEAVRGLPLPAGALYRMTAGRLQREGILGAGRGGRGRVAQVAP